MSEPPPLRATVAGLPSYIAGRKADSDRIAALASNESHLPPLPGVVAAISQAANRVNRYPDMSSSALLAKLASRLGVGVEQLAVGPGSVGVLAQIITAFADAGDEVVFAWRSFEAYLILCQIAGAQAVKVPLRADEHHDLDAMAAAITTRTKVVLLCSPNNPTGTVIPAPALADFLDQVPTRVAVVLDEAYVEYAPDSSALALLSRHPNLIVLRTFSKAWGLAGLRVGYAIAAPGVAEGLRKTQLPFSVSALAEAATLAALDATAIVGERAAAVVGERDRLVAGVRDLGWQVPDSGGNFFWLRCSDPVRTDLVAAFDAADILVRGYPGDGVRITIADSASNDRVLGVLRGFSQMAAAQ